MSNKFQIDFSKHKSFVSLLSKFEVNTEKLLIPTLELTGVPFTLQNVIVKELSDNISQRVIYASRDSFEVREYLESLQRVELIRIKYEDLVTIITNHGYLRVPKVNNQAEFAISGEVIIFWPLGEVHPIKVSFFGDDAEESFFIDELYGKKLLKVESTYVGNLKNTKSSIFETAIMILGDQEHCASSSIVFGGDTIDTFNSKEDLRFDFAYPQLFFQRFDLLEQVVNEYARNGYQIYLMSRHANLLPLAIKKYACEVNEEYETGFILPQLKVFLLTDRELLGTVFLKKQARRLSSKQARQLLASLEGEIEIGDYIVHEDHGIGVYQGLKQESYIQEVPRGFGVIDKKTIYEDYLLVSYAEGDELYVPLLQIEKITKYIGPDGEEPLITRLGRTDWVTLRAKVKTSIELYAKELVEQFAKRELAKAPEIKSVSSDNYEKFVLEFPYQETSDQERCEREVITDLSSEKPMNRLIVGDVGYGKTEIAIRAAFKVVEAGLQVAVLCPTTILTAQHEKVFMDRFKSTHYKVASLSRANKKSKPEILKELEKGEINILIGTHSLLGSGVNFKNLGLVIIDEEQKFGVLQKEKLKKIRYGVHVLSMSATPIPRTLSMALSAIQEISLIQTPPEGRKAINTVITPYDNSKMVDAVMKEIQRNGQVYYVHNRVQNIASIYEKLVELLPKVRIAVAHGQMPPDKLERTVEDFYANKYDLLLCTTIIENGIDMPHVNTIIVEHAQMFGLGQLYQLRGRVGRSERQAFAYFFYDGGDIESKQPYVDEDGNVIKIKDKEYKKRLRALKELNELGAGFKLASRDLEIRGAGNLLGKQQHGNIKHMGYGLYIQLLAEEIERLKALVD